MREKPKSFLGLMTVKEHDVIMRNSFDNIMANIDDKLPPLNMRIITGKQVDITGCFVENLTLIRCNNTRITCNKVNGDIVFNKCHKKNCKKCEENEKKGVR